MTRKVGKILSEKLAPFEIFRKADSISLKESGRMQYSDMAPAVEDGLQRAYEAGMAEGVDARVLFDTPGFSLIYSWFKSRFPLPLHTHDVDCLYIIMSGSLRLGSETLGTGDGFFLRAGTPCTYTPGEEGLEILEFRQRNDFDIRFLAKGAAFWSKAIDTVTVRRERWKEEQPQSQRS